MRSPLSGKRQMLKSATPLPLANSTSPPWCPVQASGILLIFDSRGSASAVAPVAALRYKLKVPPPRLDVNRIEAPSGDQIGTMLCDRSNLNCAQCPRLMSHNQRLPPCGSS